MPELFNLVCIVVCFFCIFLKHVFFIDKLRNKCLSIHSTYDQLVTIQLLIQAKNTNTVGKYWSISTVYMCPWVNGHRVPQRIQAK